MTQHAFRVKRLRAAVPALAALTLAALAPMTAQASASSLVMVSNLHIQLIDLDASDGIAPGIQFGFGNSTTGSLQALTTVNGVNVNQYADVPVGTAYGPLVAVNGGATSTATMLAGDVLGFAGPGVITTAFASGDSAMAWGLGFVTPVYFSLTANTRMVVTANVATSVQSTQGGTASAYAALAASDLNNVYFANDTSYSFASNGGTPSLSPRTSLQISYDNLGANAYAGYMYAQASAFVTSVPEPQSVALMLAGLGVLGAAARRRSQGR